VSEVSQSVLESAARSSTTAIAGDYGATCFKAKMTSRRVVAATDSRRRDASAITRSATPTGNRVLTP
jgi:hypothetical protein